MSERIETFTASETPKLSVRLPVGDIRIESGSDDGVVIRLRGSEKDLSRFLVEQRGDTLYIEPERGRMGRWSSVDLTIESATPVELTARLASSDLRAGTPLASLGVDAAAGDVDVEDVLGDLTVKTASGDVRAGTVGGSLDVATASGDVRCGDVGGDVSVKTASGDVQVADVGGDVNIKGASGDVIVGVFRGDAFDAKTLAGDVSLGVTAGRVFDVSFQTLSGDVRTDFPVSSGSSGSPARISVKSMSGDVVVHGAE